VVRAPLEPQPPAPELGSGPGQGPGGGEALHFSRKLSNFFKEAFFQFLVFCSRLHYFSLNPLCRVEVRVECPLWTPAHSTGAGTWPLVKGLGRGRSVHFRNVGGETPQVKDRVKGGQLSRYCMHTVDCVYTVQWKLCALYHVILCLYTVLCSVQCNGLIVCQSVYRLPVFCTVNSMQGTAPQCPGGEQAAVACCCVATSLCASSPVLADAPKEVLLWQPWPGGWSKAVHRRCAKALPVLCTTCPVLAFSALCALCMCKCSVLVRAGAPKEVLLGTPGRVAERGGAPGRCTSCSTCTPDTSV